MIHPTYRSLDAPVRLLGLAWRQWLVLLVGGGSLIAAAHWLALPTKPAISLCTVAIGVPLGMAYLSEETGYGFGQAIADMLRWVFVRRSFRTREDWLLGAHPCGPDVIALLDGTYVRVLDVSSVNPLVMDPATAEAAAASFARVAARLADGRSLQFIAEADALPVASVLAAEATATEAAAAALARASNQAGASAIRALADSQAETIRSQSADLAALALRYFVVVPWRPRPRFGRGRRDPAVSAARALRDSARHTDGVRTDLESMDLRVRLLASDEVLAFLERRLPPDVVPDGRAPGHLRVGETPEQTLYLGSIPDQTWLGWPLHLMQSPRPFTLTLHVHATDRYRERAAQRRRHRRLWGLNRGAEMRGRPIDPSKQQQEDEAAALNEELAVSAGAGVYRMSMYLSLREPSGDPELLREQVEALQREAVAVCDARLRAGRGAQSRLWQSSLPLGVDVARRSRKYVSRNVGDSFPLVGTRCGSPHGVPLGYAQPGRTLERLDPFDPSHENHLLVVNGKSGTGKTMTTILLLLRVLARGGRGFIVDRAGHFDFLCSLVPGAQSISLGARESSNAINPWDVADPARPGNEKVDFLLALHALLIGRSTADADSVLGVVESNQLGLAIRSVYDRCALTGELPRELLLQEDLYRRAADEQAAGAPELAARLRMLAESLHNYVGEGPYAYLVDRATSVTGDAPLVAFDTRRVPDDLAGAVLFALAEHVTRRIESEREAALRDDSSELEWAGRSFLVIDEAWKLVERRATGRWVNELARRSRHLALFLVAISQQLSDFNTEHGRALLSNASMLLLFRQLPEELAYVRDALRLSDEEVAAIASLATAKRQFSTAFFVNGTRGRGVVSIRVGPREYWMATNDPGRDEPLRRAALREAGGDPWRAVEFLCNPEWRATRTG
ncbi:MAG: VirB4 family type IV secretion system protein [Catenulispora sp.]